MEIPSYFTTGINWTCLVSALVGEIQFSFLRAEIHPGLLAHHLGIHGFVGLHAHHQLVPATLISKNVTRHVCKLQPNLGFPLIQGFSAAEDEGDACRDRRSRVTTKSEEINAALAGLGVLWGGYHPSARCAHRGPRWQRWPVSTPWGQWGRQGNPAWRLLHRPGRPRTDPAPRLTLTLDWCTSAPSPVKRGRIYVAFEM